MSRQRLKIWRKMVLLNHIVNLKFEITKFEIIKTRRVFTYLPAGRNLIILTFNIEFKFQIVNWKFNFKQS